MRPETKVVLLTAVLLFGFAFSGMVNAVPVDPSVKTAAWDVPTTRTDGTVLSAGEISTYTLYCGNVAGIDPGTAVLVEVIPGTEQSIVINVDPSLVWYCAMSTTDTDGVEGPLGNEVRMVFPPNGPVIRVTVTIELAVK